MRKVAKRAKKPGDMFKSFLGSGTLKSKEGCGLSQRTGMFQIELFLEFLNLLSICLYQKFYLVRLFYTIVFSGLTVVVDHLNRMRDLSHFRAIHRGSFFLEMRGLGPRRLTGDAWG